MDFYKRYRPLTAAPFRQDVGYAEFEPCEALKPYIRCFWGICGQPEEDKAQDTLVIPDTCMDIIFRIDNKENGVQDAVYRYGYTDQAHLSHEFKRFHSMTIKDAKKYAFENVAFLQDEKQMV